jgi:uncharacterized membrane protein
MTKARVEAFSDGVFAIAITLLVLNLAVPDFQRLGSGGLAEGLRVQWPAFAAFGVSFAVIGIIWVNHHAVFAQVQTIDRTLLFLNLLLLAAVVFMPYPTALMSHAFEARRDERLATAIYAATSTTMGIGFDLFWLYLDRHRDLLHEPLRTSGTRSLLLRAGWGTVVYVATIGLAFVNPYACLIVFGALALFYVFDFSATARR